MKYWWVNHKRTYRQEIAGSYLWCPKRNLNGARNQSYENIKFAEPGDVVISYADTEIKAIGIVKANYIDHDRPIEFGSQGESWDKDGMLLSVKFVSLSDPIRPKQFLTELMPILPKRYSPINRLGNGSQPFYLTQISGEVYNLVKTKIGLTNVIEEIENDIEETEIDLSPIISITEKEDLRKSRIGQGRFRDLVIKINKRCIVTGASDVSLLIASHIKPWSKSTNEERLDGNNGLLLSPQYDKLFDKGLMTFDDKGKLIISVFLQQDIVHQWSIPVGKMCGSFTGRQKLYLEFHRNSVFKD